MNSGGIIFKNGKFQKILDLIIEIVSYSRAGGLTTCDQYLHSTVVAATLLDINIKLDTENIIFQSLFFEDVSVFESKDGRYVNRLSGRRPCVFHGNGNDGFDKLNLLLESTKLN